MGNGNLLELEIVTPQKVVYQSKATAVTLPGVQGSFQVLNRHAPIVSSLNIGLTKVIDENEKNLYFATSSGFAEVHNNVVSVLVENADDVNEVDIDQKQKALEEAEAKFKETKSDKDRDTYLATKNCLACAKKYKKS